MLNHKAFIKNSRVLSIKEKLIIRRMKTRNLPSPIIEYTENVFKAKIQGKYSDTLIRFPRRVIKAIDTLVKEASTAIGQTVEELINLTDFNASDLPSERIESLFAELRAVNFLNSEGFTNICFIKSKRKQKRADISAEKSSKNYVVEVTCSSSRASSNRWDIASITDFIVKKMKGSQNKQLQLLKTLEEYKANRMVLIVFLDTEDKNALNSTKDAMVIAQQAFKQIGENNLHICIIMGKPEVVYEIPSGSLLIKILGQSGYIKGPPLLISMLNGLIKIFAKRLEQGSGNIVFPPWTKSS